MGGEGGRQRIPIRRDVEASLAVSTPVSSMAPRQAVIADTRRPPSAPPHAAGGRLLECVVAASPMGRVGQPEEIAVAALYLASDESSFTTGRWLSPNGGIFIG